MTKIILFCLLFLLGNSTLYAQQQYYVLSVGVSDYEGTKNDLHFADVDAKRVAQFFIDAGVPSGHIKLLTNQNATRQNILSTLNTVFSAAQPNDVVIFYFSGHGDKGVFLPADFTGFSNALLHREVKAAFKNCAAKHKLCIADACFAGSIRTKSFDSSRDSLKTVEEKLKTATAKAYKEANNDVVVMMASRANEESKEMSALGQGAFTYYLLQGWRGTADLNGDKIITIKELFRYTQQKVIAITKDMQHPVVFGKFDADMVLMRL